MTRDEPRHPTARELSILQVLWEQGASTVREVHQALKHKHGIAYNTVLTMLQIMLDKGLVVRDETKYPQRYAATHTKEATQELLTRDFIDRVFGGSSLQLVQRALAAKPADQQELEFLEAFLKQRKKADHD
jgi:predicted transcriptional regulator